MWVGISQPLGPENKRQGKGGFSLSVFKLRHWLLNLHHQLLLVLRSANFNKCRKDVCYLAESESSETHLRSGNLQAQEWEMCPLK